MLLIAAAIGITVQATAPTGEHAQAQSSAAEAGTPSAAPPAPPVVSHSPAATATPPATAALAPAGANAASSALSVLAAVPSTTTGPDEPYDRARFGDPWTDVDRNGCDTRNDILGRDLIDPVFKVGTRQCKVLRGTLIDPYDGRRQEFVSGPDTSVLVQIDHVVALGWAWNHGADRWDDTARVRFANDPANLTAASEAMNQEKSALGPSQWLPPAAGLRCAYAETWVKILTAYPLTVPEADRKALETVLYAC